MKKYKSVLDHPVKKNAIKVFGKDPDTMAELFQMCIDVMNDNFAKTEEIRVTGFAIDVTHSSKVSNSHCAPLLGYENFMRNEELPNGYSGWEGRAWLRLSRRSNSWASDIVRPTITYTGSGGAGAYNGPWATIAHQYYRAKLAMKQQYKEPEIYSWDYKLFDMDFPGLDNDCLKLYHEQYAEYEKQMEQYRTELTWAKVAGKNYPIMPPPPKEPTFKMQWTDPDVLALDQAFIKHKPLLRNKKVRNLLKF